MGTLILIPILFIFIVLLIDAVDEDDPGTHLGEYRIWSNLVKFCMIGFWIFAGLAVIGIAIHI